MKISTVTILLSLFASTYTQAIQPEKYGWAMSMGAVSSKEDGINIAVSYDHKIDTALLRWGIIDMNMYSEEAEGYREEKLSNGNTVCRDESNGQFAEDEKCNPIALDVGSTIDINYMFGELDTPHLIGIGARAFGDKEYGNSVIPYVTGNISFTRGFSGFIRLGSEYTQLSLGYSF